MLPVKRSLRWIERRAVSKGSAFTEWFRHFCCTTHTVSPVKSEDVLHLAAYSIDGALVRVRSSNALSGTGGSMPGGAYREVRLFRPLLLVNAMKRKGDETKRKIVAG